MEMGLLLFFSTGSAINLTMRDVEICARLPPSSARKDPSRLRLSSSEEKVRFYEVSKNKQGTFIPSCKNTEAVQELHFSAAISFYILHNVSHIDLSC